MAAYLERVDLSAHGFYATPDITGFGGNFPFNYLCYGKACGDCIAGTVPQWCSSKTWRPDGQCAESCL